MLLHLKYFVHKWTNYEYWPWWLLYLLVAPYYLWLSIKARNLFFVKDVNPGLDRSGFKNYSKYKVLDLIPTKYKPHAQLIKQGDANTVHFDFPLILKPDQGERGKGVTLIHNEVGYHQYLSQHSGDVIMQAYVDLPSEGTLFFIKYPDDNNGFISSFTTKEFLNVVGDGKHTIAQLMRQSARAFYQVDRMDKSTCSIVLPSGVRRVLEPIGNHCRGTRFINSNAEIDQALTDVFNTIASDIPGFYYGRFDFKYRDLETLRRGEDIAIVELNGVSADPAHIFDPSFGLINSLREICRHWDHLYIIYSQIKNRDLHVSLHVS
jgi:hypothetical protein